MADLIIESGSASAALIVPGSPGRSQTPAPRREDAPFPSAPALEHLSRFIEDSISISPQARLLSETRAELPKPLPEILRSPRQSSLRSYEEALRLGSYANGSSVQGPAMDRVSVSAEARRLIRF